MPTAEQIPKAPPLRFALTEEQAAALDVAKPSGSVALVVGYAQRHPWPDPDKFTLNAWFIPMSDAEAALESAGIMAKTKRRRKVKTPAKRRTKSRPAER